MTKTVQQWSLVLILVLASSVAEGTYIDDVLSKAEEFGYAKHNGPDTWPYKFEGCAGSLQSPIDLDERECIIDAVLPSLHWHKVWQPRELEIKNTWHSVEITYKSLNGRPTLTGGTLKGEFVLSQVHFHWNSEHSMHGRFYGVEAHMVHYNNKYVNIDEASKKPNGLAVVALLLKDSHRGNNTEMCELIDSLDRVRRGGTSSHIGVDALKWLWIALEPDTFFTYVGSLTTPPCTEGVTWIVLKEHGHIGHQQILEFHKLRGHEGAIFENSRPVQPMNGRPVMYHSDDRLVFPTDD